MFGNSNSRSPSAALCPANSRTTRCFSFQWPFPSGIFPASDDGLIGPSTLGALTAALKSESPGVVAVRLARQRVAFYRQLVKRDPTQQAFLRGWLNRVEVLVTVIRVGAKKNTLVPGQ